MFKFPQLFSSFSHLHHWTYVLTASLLVVSLETAFIKTNSSLDLTQRVSISVSQTCEDEILCRSKLDPVLCLSYSVCTNRTCNGRTDFPFKELPLQTWQMTNLTVACTLSTGKIPDGLSLLTFDPATTLHVNGSSEVSSACYAHAILSDLDMFTLVFWLDAECTNCSVLELKFQDGVIHFRVVDGRLCVRDECLGNTKLESMSWTLMAVTVYRKVLSVYADGIKLNFTNAVLQNVIVADIFIGSTEVATSNNEFSLYDVQFYHDILTHREMEYHRTGLTDSSEDSCRCPSSHPILSSSGTECQNDIGDVHPRYNTALRFNPPSVLIEPSNNDRWASAETGSVTLLLAFNQSYEIESIEIEYANVLPAHTAISLKFDSVEKTEEEAQCNGLKCKITFAQNSPLVTVTDYMARVADEIKIVLGRTNPSDTQSFIISKISISGRCDCYGNADTCDLTDESYVCQCNAGTNSLGSNCKSCVPNFFREASDFGCSNPCECSQGGVTDVNDMCEQNGGKCKCKELVTGTSCNQCKPWTYDLDINNEKGCSPCICHENGSALCNQATGECTCKTNTLLPNCDVCVPNHFGLDTPEGCRPCNCGTAGTKSQKKTCDVLTGQCECKENVQGLQCRECKPEFFDLAQGCRPCNCHPVGSDHSSCDTLSGQCPCRSGVITDKKCTPEIISIDPNFGPEIGGTQLTIRGKLLGNSSHHTSVFLGTESQTILSIDDSVVVIDTNQYNSGDKNLEIKLSWDGISNALISSSFMYRSNPTLNQSKAVNVNSYVSGGCQVKIYGSNLGNVKYPRLDVINKAKPTDVAHGICEHVEDFVMCRTPAVNNLYSSPQDQFQMTVVFDGVRSSNMGEIHIREDPVFYDAGNIRFQYPFEKTISLYGKNMQTACHINSVHVFIGVVTCTIVHISNTSIECKPRGGKPRTGKMQTIEITVGNIRKTVGTLEYLDFYETNGFIIICSCIGALILLIIILIIVCRCRRYRKQRRNAASKFDNRTVTSDRPQNTYSDLTQLVSANPTGNGHSGIVHMESVIREPKKGIVNTEAETSVLTDEFLPYLEPSIRDAVIDIFVGGSSFTMGSCKKTGKHAKIMDGTLKRNGQEIQKLYIRSVIQPISGILKTSQGDSEPTLLPWANLALSECLRLRNLKHNHILNCVGIGIDKQRFHLLYVHSKGENLKDLVADTNKEFSVRQLLGFSQQVATGLAHLATKDITHKDVAARNCMVDEYSVVKIGDSSFAWDFYPNEYVYNEQRERYLPIRWMAPESLTNGFYDMRTDVWSIGVLIWELLTRGCLPFHEINDAQVTDYVLSGYILGKPETISDRVYELLRNCWSPENESRPYMTSLSRSLSYILESENDDTYANGYLVTSQLSQGVSTPRRGGNRNSNTQFYCSTDLSNV